MELNDVRRLTGANLLWDRPGAVGEAVLADVHGLEEFLEQDFTRMNRFWFPSHGHA